MSPELKILIINAVVLAVAYLGLYPSIQNKTLANLMYQDTALTILVLVTSAALFAGSDLSFNLIILDVNWFAFTLITLGLMEAPLFFWFCKKHGIDITPGGGRK